jgi:geranylgeranyl pyrophosphate synthase
MDHLATGEIIQMTTKNKWVNDNDELFREQVETYLHKTYYKTAALMANALRAVPLFFEGATV